MSQTTYRSNVAISYNTRTDMDLVNALMEALASIDVQGLCLPYLSVSGYGTDQPDNPQRWRRDGWVNHFMDILEQSIGMIILSTGNSLPSERTPWRGIWVERNLAETQSGAECIFRLEHPSAVKPAPAPKPEALRRLIEELDDLKGSTDRKYDAAEGRIAYLEDAIGAYEAPPSSPPPPLPDPKDWAQQVLPALQVWINSRQNERPPKAVRFKSDLVNDKGYFDPIEVGRTFGKDRLGNDVPGTFYWYFLAVLDLYDCVWICRRCFSASDVWIRTECRPPARCPNCGYATGQDAPEY
jgi:hypothetical protein